jgi:predicted MPP superfamily phosphohydrolase
MTHLIEHSRRRPVRLSFHSLFTFYFPFRLRKTFRVLAIPRKPTQKPGRTLLQLHFLHSFTFFTLFNLHFSPSLFTFTFHSSLFTFYFPFRLRKTFRVLAIPRKPTQKPGRTLFQLHFLHFLHFLHSLFSLFTFHFKSPTKEAANTDHLPDREYAA